MICQEKNLQGEERSAQDQSTLPVESHYVPHVMTMPGQLYLDKFYKLPVEQFVPSFGAFLAAFGIYFNMEKAGYLNK